MARRVPCICVVVALVLFTSCRKSEQGRSGQGAFIEGRQTFRGLLALRDQISKEFHENVGDVSIANERMLVKFVNSPLTSRTSEERQQRADAVASFVLKNYKQPVSSVSIQFVSEGDASRASASRETYLGRLSVRP
jgi:hypothetical protein